jgi:preprotein translocase subunit SecE
MNQTLDFLRQTKVELAKVVWPSKEQTVKLTVIVVIVTIIVGFFLFGLDWIFIQLLTLLTK